VRIAGTTVETPVVRLYVDDAPAEIWLKLESLQPIGSFKLRGAANAILSAPRAELANGVDTSSTGNMAQGVAWMARELGVPATIVVPDNASQAKLGAVERMGGRIVRVPWEDWWAAVESGSPKEAAEDIEGFFVHPVRDEAVMAGNGTIGLELAEQLEGFDTVLIPWGGGGLTTGVASALRAVAPAARVFVCEPETGAPVRAAIDGDGVPSPVPFTPSFVDGAGSGSLLPEMWERAKPLVSGSFVVSLEETAATVRLLLQRERIVAEGAAALPVATALAGGAGEGRVVCIVSGGNIDASRLTEIIAGRVPD
jgi:threonine dehydratase